MDSRVGRNEPCPCGSGKKYKKCCMQAKEINENAKRSLKEKLIEFSREPVFKTDLEKAKKIFLEGREPDDADMVMFVDWFIHDYRLKDHGKRLIELFYIEKSPFLAPIEKEILEGWQDFFKEHGYTFINFAFMKATEIPKIVTPEGDPILFAKAVYKVKDYDKAVNALYEIPDLEIVESNKDEIHFKLVAEIKDHYIHEGSIKFETSLVSDSGDPQLRSMGDLTINNKQLILDCLSEKRLELGKDMLKTLGDSIEFISESKQHPDLSGRKNEGEKGITQQDEIDEPVREMLRKKFLEDHYRRWVDMPIGSLGGMTPREASKTQEGREKLKEVLKVVENAEERRHKAGELSYDVNKLREMLRI